LVHYGEASVGGDNSDGEREWDAELIAENYCDCQKQGDAE
jgi:hypothetical protein